MAVPVSYSDLLIAPTYDAVKLEILQGIAAENPPIFSWETGSVPSGLVEIQAGAKTDYLAAQVVVVQGGQNSTATGDALTVQSDQVYDNQRELGTYTVGYVTLTDTGNSGSYTFAATSLQLSAGANSTLQYTGQYAAATGLVSVTLPRGGSVDVIVQAQGVGATYAQIGIGALNFFVSGFKPGVSARNPSDWLTKYSGSQQGTDDESDVTLRARNLAKWDAGVGSPERVYRQWAIDATSGNASAADRVTRCNVYTGSNIFDPGTIQVVIASSTGGVSGGVVTQVQDYIAPMQTGGFRIPETAKAIVSSATPINVAVIATLKVQSTYNTAAFQAQVVANVRAYFSDLPIGGTVSAERVIEVLLYPAGVSAGVIVDATVISPGQTLPFGPLQLPVPSPITLTFVSV